jgi:hypothetical protein
MDTVATYRTTRHWQPSTLPARLLNLLKIRELTRDRIGEEFCLMKSLFNGIDRATRRGRNAVIKLVRWKGFVIRQSCHETVRASTSSGTNGSKPAVSWSSRARHERIYSAVP